MYLTKACKQCGKDFVKPYKYSQTQWESVKFCSKSCIGDSLRGETIEKTCICGKTVSFTQKGLQDRKKYCSHECQHKGMRLVGSKDYRQVYVEKKKVSEHRKVMAQKIGRELKSSEVVHHWDENKQNNKEDNLALFRSGVAHLRLHSFATRHGLKIEELRFEQPWLII